MSSPNTVKRSTCVRAFKLDSTSAANSFTPCELDDGDAGDAGGVGVFIFINVRFRRWPIIGVIVVGAVFEIVCDKSVKIDLSVWAFSYLKKEKHSLNFTKYSE